MHSKLPNIPEPSVLLSAKPRIKSWCWRQGLVISQIQPLGNFTQAVSHTTLGIRTSVSLHYDRAHYCEVCFNTLFYPWELSHVQHLVYWLQINESGGKTKFLNNFDHERHLSERPSDICHMSPTFNLAWIKSPLFVFSSWRNRLFRKSKYWTEKIQKVSTQGTEGKAHIFLAHGWQGFGPW